MSKFELQLEATQVYRRTVTRVIEFEVSKKQVIKDQGLEGDEVDQWRDYVNDWACECLDASSLLNDIDREIDEPQHLWAVAEDANIQEGNEDDIDLQKWCVVKP